MAEVKKSSEARRVKKSPKERSPQEGNIKVIMFQCNKPEDQTEYQTKIKIF